jgi:hypothetical protein
MGFDGGFWIWDNRVWTISREKVMLGLWIWAKTFVRERI